MDLGQKLKQARLEAGLSQRQLCGSVITRNMLSQIENGSAKPSMDTLQYLAGALGKSVSYFLEDNAASPNQALLSSARSLFARGEYAAALSALEDFQLPDPVAEAEYHLLTALCALSLAEKTEDNAQLLARAAEAGKSTPYYTPDLERRRLLLLGDVSGLPGLDDELLLRARHSLSAGDPARAARLLDAAEDQDAPAWLHLRGDCAMACGDYTHAARLYRRVECPAVYSRLEQCYLKLEDYKMAYHYATLQR